MLTILFAITSVIGIGLVIWSCTKSGKKWIESL